MKPMLFQNPHGSFGVSSVGCGDYGTFGAATSGKRKGPISAFKEKYKLARDKGPSKVIVKRSADGKTCEVQLIFPNPQKGEKDLVYKEVTKSPFRTALRTLCEGTKAGSSRTIEAKGEKLKSLDGVSEFEYGRVSGRRPGSKTRFTGIIQLEQALKNIKAKKKSIRARKLSTDRITALKKYKRFANEDAALGKAYAKNDMKKMSKVLKRLAGVRDRKYKQAVLTAEGKEAGQVTGRVILAVATHGVSEIVRLGFEKPLEEGRRKVAERHQGVGDAAAAVYGFWMKKLKDKARASKDRKAEEAVFATEAQLAPGAPAAAAAAAAEEESGYDENSAAPDMDGEGSDEGMSDMGYIGLGALGALLMAPVILR